VTTVYAAAAVALTWPLATVLTTRLGAPEGAGDPYLNLWALGWGVQSWLRDPLGTLGGRAFDAPIFFPAPLTLTYSDHQLIQALAAAPVYAATGNLTLTYNVVLLGSLIASGLAMHLLARTVTGSTSAAFMAGLAWACWPYRTAQLLHLQLQALYFLPLALWALTRVAAGRRWRDAALLGVCAGLQAIVSVYYGVMTAVTLLIAAPVLAWSTGQWRGRRYWSRVTGSALLAGFLIVPVALPYIRSQAAEGFGRNLYEAANHAAAFQSYTQVPPGNLVYGRSGLLAPRPPEPGGRDRQHVEHQMFPGLVLFGCALLGLGTGWRSDHRALVLTSAAIAVSGLWLSLGPEGPLGLYHWVATHAFGFEAIRAPARFGVVAMLGLVLLAAVGVSRIRQRLVPAVLVGAMLTEYANVPIVFVPAPATDTEVGRWLRDAPEPGAVAYLPVGMDRENTPAMVEALQHGRPIVNGYSGQRPGSYTAIVESLATLPDVEGRAMLKELGVRFVISPVRWALDDTATPFVERAAFGDSVIYEVQWTPEAEAALAAAPDVLPPAPGPVPFPFNEEATFAVRWVGDVSAGTITLRTGVPSGADREAGPDVAWRLEAAANTADWVSRFFEARDLFTTLARNDLSPVLHVRNIEEGSRRITRAYVYDPVRRQVRVGPSANEARSPEADASPFAPGARDAVTALYYLRTLPLQPGADLAIPVNDAGRSLIVRVRPEAVETVATPRGAVEALRMRVIIERRLARRTGMSGTLWLSTDTRRIPVRLDVSAGFGQVRLELVDYRP